MRITFIPRIASYADSITRIQGLKRVGVRPIVFAFDRGDHGGKLPSGEYRPLGHIQDGHYHKRLLPYLKALLSVRSGIKESDAVYTFSLDTLLLGWLASRSLRKQPKIVYQVNDIRQILLEHSLPSRILRRLERYLLRRIDLLVVTSEAFVTEYFEGMQGASGLSYQVIENKLAGDAFAPDPITATCHEWNGVLRIGYFGIIRCSRSIEILRRVTERSDRVHVLIRGIPRGTIDLDLEARRNPRIDYGGPYRSPDDLPAMYSQVDVVWVGYPYEGVETGNWRWARTNRFYAACFFGKPVLARAGTEDGRVVEELGLGICLDFGDIEEAADCVLRVNEAVLSRWNQSIAQLPHAFHTYTDEHKRLLKALQ